MTICWEDHKTLPSLSYLRKKNVFISRKGISSSYQSCYQNHAIKEIKCEYDPCMFVVTNTQQGLDVLLPTIWNEINIYDSSSNHEIIGSPLKRNFEKIYIKQRGSLQLLRFC